MHQLRILRWSISAVLALMVSWGIARHLAAADAPKPVAKGEARCNRLAKETSPYLLLHAHNPVDWYPWGPEAFEKAKKEGKMIFLSVGYSSCYWCHVMERNVFTNEAIAKTLNENFVCIKVDREERPDVDDIYMTALQVYYQAIGAPSSGGWPLSMFLTPDAKPLAGGTYFPPEDTDASQGFPSILAKLQEMWATKRDTMNGNADILTNETRRLMRPKLALKPVEINDKLAEFVLGVTVSSFDPEFGGVDFHVNRPDGPKFPTPTKLQFVQQELNRKPNDDVAQLLDLTLMQIACGGIRDHVGGGFHRYSVDRQWQVPHFEKMLYDQAQLADLYVEAYRTTQKPLYKQVAEELFAFVDRELTSPDGGFYSALDAETNGVEGEFYVWDATEIDNVLGEAAGAFKQSYKVKDLPDFEHGNVLRLLPKKLPKPESGDVINIAASDAVTQRDEFSHAKQKLLDVRNNRKRPLRDKKILTCWNGLMLGAYARSAAVLKHPEYIRTAERAAGFILTKLRDSQGHLLHTSTNGQSRLNAYLDDYAFVIDGLLALHDATNDAKWLKAARQLQDDQLRMFLDEANGGFYFTSHLHEELLARTKNCYDGVLPAGNSVSARNLLKLAKKAGVQAYHDEARATIELFATNIEQAPRNVAVLALAANELLEFEASQKGAVAEGKNEIIPVAGAQAKPDSKASNEPLVPLVEQKEDRTKKDEHARSRVYLSSDRLPAGGTCEIAVVIKIDDHWHIQANPPMPENFIATEVTVKSKQGVTLSDVKYPKGKLFESGNEKAMIYDGEIAIRGTIKVPEKSAGQTDELEIAIRYQACNDEEVCLPPKTIKLNAKPAIAKKGEAAKGINSRLFPPAENPPK